MCRDMALSGCKCDSGFNLNECVKRAAGMVPQWHYRAGNYHCVQVAQKIIGMRWVN